MNNKIIISLLFLIYVLNFSLKSKAECEPYIFKVNCTFIENGSKFESKQAGFKISGIDGIFTTLHGLSHNCTSNNIRVFSCNYEIPEEYELTEVDIANDVAIIKPKSNKTKFYKLNDGYIIDTTSALSYRTHLLTFWFLQKDPFENTFIQSFESSGNPIPLSSYLESVDFKAVVDRNSPSISSLIATLSTKSDTGSSGCPLLIEKNSKKYVVGLLSGGLINSPFSSSYGPLLKYCTFKKINLPEIKRKLSLLKEEVKVFHACFSKLETPNLVNTESKKLSGKKYISRALDVASTIEKYGCNLLNYYCVGLFGNTISNQGSTGNKSEYANKKFPVSSYIIKACYYHYCTQNAKKAIEAAEMLNEKYEKISRAEQKIISRHFGYTALHDLIVDIMSDTTYLFVVSQAENYLTKSDYQNGLKFAQNAYNIRQTKRAREIILLCTEKIFDFGLSNGDSAANFQNCIKALHYYKTGLEVNPESPELNTKAKICLSELIKQGDNTEFQLFVQDQIKNRFQSLANLYIQNNLMPNFESRINTNPVLPNSFSLNFECGMTSSNKFENLGINFMHFNFPPGNASYSGIDHALELLHFFMISTLTDTILNLNFDSISIDITGWVDGLKFRHKPHYDESKYGVLDFKTHKIGPFDYNSKLALYRAGYAREQLKKTPSIQNDNQYHLNKVVMNEISGKYRKVVILIHFFGASMDNH